MHTKSDLNQQQIFKEHKRGPKNKPAASQYDNPESRSDISHACKFVVCFSFFRARSIIVVFVSSEVKIARFFLIFTASAVNPNATRLRHWERDTDLRCFYLY